VIVKSDPAPYTRRAAVYVPKQYVPGTEAPFIVGADGHDPTLFAALDNLIAGHRVPVMIAISIERLSRKRKKRTSNKEWKSLAKEDALIAKMKDGRTHLAHKP
jgi:enterochelin esterase-like enzyme